MSRDDFRYAIRSLIKHPRFSLSALLTLSLGIGVVAAIFSLTNAVVLRPLPYPEADRLTFMSTRMIDNGDAISSLSYPDYLLWKEKNSPFSEIAASADWLQVTMTGTQDALRLHAHFVSAEYFNLLGAEAQLGRLFDIREGTVPGAHPVAVLTHDFWQSAFGGQESTIGSIVRLNENVFTVIGVLSPDFHNLSQRTQIFLPVAMADVVMGGGYLDNRLNRWLHPIGKLRPGVSLPQAKESMEALTESIGEEFSDNRYIRSMVQSITTTLFNHYEFDRSVKSLMAAVTLLLLICFVNVAGLFFLRSLDRQREFAMRQALGSNRRRLTHQLILEGVLLTLAGGVGGLLVALWMTGSMLGLGALELPRFVNIQVLSGSVILATVAICLIGGLLFGLLSASRSPRFNLSDSLAQRSSPAAGSHRNLLGRRLLVIVQVALAMSILVAAGLMVRSFKKLQTTDTGFDPEGIFLVRTMVADERYNDRVARRALISDYLERISAIPGVDQAMVWGPGIPGMSNLGMTLILEGEEAIGSEQSGIYVRHHSISPNALDSMKITVLRGRGIGPQDNAEGQFVAVVSETMAEQLWPGEDPIGRRFRPQWSEDLWFEIVGVAADAIHQGRLWEWQSRLQRDIYISSRQVPTYELSFLMKTQLAEETMAPQLRRILREIDPDLPLFGMTTLRGERRSEETLFKFKTRLATVFSILAVLFACVGIYSVIAYSVSQQRQEIGVRMALGAQRSHVMWMVLAQALKLVVAGLLLGLLGAAFGTRLMASQIYDIELFDLTAYVLLPILVILVSMLAVAIPARRAMNIEPTIALREE